MPIRERNGKWHYRFYVNGREYSGQTGLDATARNETAAMRKEAEARSLVLEGKERLLKLEVQPFNDAARQFLQWADGHYNEHPNSAKRIRTSFASLLEFFKKTPVTSITPGRIDDYTAWRRSEHQVRDITIRHDLHAMSKFMQYAKRHNWIRENFVNAEECEIPSDADAVRIHVITSDEEASYFAAAAELELTNVADLGRIMLEQGCRPEELYELAKASVDIRAGVFQIESGKSKAARRSIKMTAATAAIIERRMRGSSPWIFPGRPKTQHAVKFNGSHDTVIERAGLSFVLYDFRHTFATRKANAGMPIPVLAKILGHGDLRSIQKYVHISESDMHAAMEKYDSRSGFGPVDMANTRENTGINGKDWEGPKWLKN